MFGTVKWFNKFEGYGLIGQTDGPDVFVHYSSIRDLGNRTLSEGDRVEFQTVPSAEGPQAVNVRRPK
jgi:CspA family cold shock protein